MRAGTTGELLLPRRVLALVLLRAALLTRIRHDFTPYYNRVFSGEVPLPQPPRHGMIPLTRCLRSRARVQVLCQRALFGFFWMRSKTERWRTRLPCLITARHSASGSVFEIFQGPGRIMTVVSHRGERARRGAAAKN